MYQRFPRPLFSWTREYFKKIPHPLLGSWVKIFSHTFLKRRRKTKIHKNPLGGWGKMSNLACKSGCVGMIDLQWDLARKSISSDVISMLYFGIAIKRKNVKFGTWRNGKFQNKLHYHVWLAESTKSHSVCEAHHLANRRMCLACLWALNCLHYLIFLTKVRPNLNSKKIKKKLL